ncbi:hypothetical protein ACE1OE_19425 [Vibrio sp. E150_011]|uniref:hypothetical protein n=1 Tax=unclassified Vibrio TaxID=2614977 RepID=UPI000C8295C8|nr:hypothetical protein [Vibrio sp. 10N.286.48.B7]PMH77849.1 hypothetical protein BCU58_11470 [Vibrio sp. 10N.286.48.B7]
MNIELRRTIEQLLVIASREGVSIIGLVDSPEDTQCQIIRAIQIDCKPETRAVDEVLIGQHCSGDLKHCETCHLANDGESNAAGSTKKWKPLYLVK